MAALCADRGVPLLVDAAQTVGRAPVHGQTLLRALDREGFAVSSGSSCSTSALEPSHVLAAMGLLSSGSLRVSLPRGTTSADVERLLAAPPRLAAEQRAS